MIRHAAHTSVAFVLTLLLIAGCAPHGGGGDGGGGGNGPIELTVLTYNIHHGEGTDKKLDLERIAGVIRASGADLVALQEVDLGTKRTNGLDEPAELARLTDMHVHFEAAMDYDGGKYGDAVLSRYPIVGHTVAHLPYRQGGQREPRVAVGVTCELPGRQRIAFISTHWDHTREPSDRLAQAEATNKHFAGVSGPAILAGDFNCEPDSPPMREIQKHWQLVTAGELSCPANIPKVSIDHVLVKPKGRWRVIETKVIDEPVASDHRPVMVKLEWPNKK